MEASHSNTSTDNFKKQKSKLKRSGNRVHLVGDRCRANRERPLTKTTTTKRIVKDEAFAHARFSLKTRALKGMHELRSSSALSS
jgi:hypothetical protein